MLDVNRSTGLSQAEATTGGAHRERLRAAVLIEHNIVYRHFIKSAAFATLVQKHDVVFVVPESGPNNKRLTVDLEPSEVGAPVERIAINPARLYQQRRLFQVSQLIWRPGPEWKHLRAIVRYMLGPKASRLYTVLALPGIFQLFRWWSEARMSAEASAMDAFVERFRPDVLIHPTVLDGVFINDFVLLGRKYRIPTIAIMNSWDNPSTKRAVVGRPDWLLVWGPQTQSHAVRFMEMLPSRAVSFGAAQFDIYRQTPRVTREEFCRRHGVDPSKRILLYAGSSKGADEYGHLCMIDEAIECGALANVEVIYRPHPWGHGGFKGERLLDGAWRHVVIESSMRSYLEGVRAGMKGAYLADYADTHDVLSSIDALVSPLSTIILEAMMHGKPVLCFLAEQHKGASFSLQKGLVHFEDMFADPSILKANGEPELIDALALLMGKVGNQQVETELRKACDHFVSTFDRSYSERLCDVVEQIAADERQSENSDRGWRS
jgi:hypothetical protein